MGRRVTVGRVMERTSRPAGQRVVGVRVYRQPTAWQPLPRTVLAMYSSTAYNIRHASDEDAAVLRYISGLDSQSPISANALIGEIHGSPAAAIELDSGRVVADPFRPTAEL